MYVVAFAAALYLLPYGFGVSPSVSASYVYQFNNRVAALVFLAGAFGLAWYTGGLAPRPGLKDSKVSPKATLGAIAFCVGIGLFLYRTWLHQPLVGEAIYFMDRLDHLASGQRIYRDFEFPYGPLLLYSPLWASRFLHITLREGYFLVWLISWGVGIWVLSLLVDALEVRTPHRTVVFLVMVLNIYPAMWSQGINYAPVRFLLTGIMALAVYLLYRREASAAQVFGTAIGCGALTAAISPEYGIAFMLGTLVFFGILCRSRPAVYWLGFGAMLVAFAVIIVVSERAGLYITLHAMSSGAYNYPLLPSIAGSLVMVSFLAAACVGYAAYREKETGSLAFYVMCICVFCMPSCFGRADAGHMELAAMPAVLVGVLAISTRRFLWVPVGIVFVVLSLLGTRGMYMALVPSVREGLERTLFMPGERSEGLYRPTVALLHLLHADTHRKAIEEKEKREMARSSTPPAGFSLPSGGQYEAPLGYFDPMLRIDTSGRVDYGYFRGLQDVFLPGQVESVIRWLKAHPERSLILYESWEDACYTFDEASQKNIRAIYGFPYAPPQRREMKVFYPLCDYIREHYVLHTKDPGAFWQVWSSTSSPRSLN